MKDLAIHAPLESLLKEREEGVEMISRGLQELGENKVFAETIDSYLSRFRHQSPLTKYLNKEELVKELDAYMWNKAYSLGGLVDILSQKKRKEYEQSLYERQFPPFTKENVIPVLEDAFLSSKKNLWEKADGVYRALSAGHSTNRPEGFYRRFIFLVPDSYSSQSYFQGVLADLISLVYLALGKRESTTTCMGEAHDILTLPKNGEWVWVMGNYFKVRAYKKGTFHFEVHPQIACRLNDILADSGDYVRYLPPKYKTGGIASKAKAPELMVDYLKATTIREIRGALNGVVHHKDGVFKILSPNDGGTRDFDRAMKHIGGEKEGNHYYFKYKPDECLKELVEAKCLPDYKTHQYYPTPKHIVSEVQTIANIGVGDRLLEPSAGTGSLLEGVNNSNLTMVEASPLNCAVLRDKFFGRVIQGDFLEFNTDEKFEKIVMNPPFTKNQSYAHVSHALTLLSQRGRLVAVVPSTFDASRVDIPKFLKVSIYDNGILYDGFEETKVKVKIVVFEGENVC